MKAARWIAGGIVAGAIAATFVVPMVAHEPVSGATRPLPIAPVTPATPSAIVDTPVPVPVPTPAPTATAAPTAAPVPTTASSPIPPGAESASADSIRVLLIPALETTVSSPVAGRMRTLESSLGASFTAGSTLVGFDCDEPVARLNMAKAEWSGAQETHEAKVRLQGLDQASQVEVAMAASAAAKARAAVALGEAQVAQCSVHAPWAGRVAKVYVRNYMTVAAGQPLLDLVKTGPLKLKLSVPSRWLESLHAGVPFDVTIEETRKDYRAQIVAVNSRIDPVSQTIEIEADMAQSYPELLAGMSGTAHFAVVR